LYKFYVGQKVKIVGNTNKIHYAIIPQVGRITRVGENTCDVLCYTTQLGGRIARQTIYTCDLQPVGCKII